MNWFNTQIAPFRHPHNCTCNDAIYTPVQLDRLSILFNLLSSFRNFILRQPNQRTLYNTERSIEIPLALHFLQQLQPGPILELGCVLPYYIFPTYQHRVIDLMDAHPISEKTDIRSLSEKDLKSNIIAISTIEHIGLSDYGIPTEGCPASDVLSKIISNAKNYFITFPLGVNSNLESYVNSHLDQLYPIFVRRDPESNFDWKVIEETKLTANDKKYGSCCCANTVCILTNIRK